MFQFAVNLSQIVLAFLLGPAFLWFLWEYLKQVKSMKIELKELVKEVKTIHVELGNQKSDIKAVETKIDSAHDKVDTFTESFDLINRNFQRSLDDRNLRLGEIERKTNQMLETQNIISRKFTEQEYQFQKLRSMLK